MPVLGNFAYYNGGTSIKYGRFYDEDDHYLVIPFIMEGCQVPVTRAETEYVNMVVLDNSPSSIYRIDKDVKKAPVFVYNLKHFLNREIIYRHGVDDVFGISYTCSQGVRADVGNDDFGLNADMDLYERFKFRHAIFSFCTSIFLVSLSYI